MGAGRFICVVVPFALTLASLVAILIACLAGVTDKSLYLMNINTANLSISSSSLASLVTSRGLDSLINSALSGSASASTNITASDLGLANSYEVSLWAYCAESTTNSTCSKAAYNWASTATNTTTLEAALGVSGVTVSLPTTITSALKTFSKVTYWTQIVYTIAAVATFFELVVGFFALCSRIGSCCTFLISGFSTLAIVAASIMATVLASITVGSVETVAKEYGVTGSISTRFLATTWIAVAFSLGSSLFWMLSICCCAPSKSERHSRRDRDRMSAQEPLTGAAAPYAGYQQVHDPYGGQQAGVNYGPNGYQVPMAQMKGRQTTGAYEPYSHGAV